METNTILDADYAPIPEINTTVAEKWANYAEYAVLPFPLLGCLFKIQSWVYASEILTWSLFFYAALLLFIPFLVLQGRGLWQIASSYLFGVGFFTLLMGRLFQIQSWPYAQEMIATMWLIGPIMAIATLIFFALHYKNLQNRNFAVNMLVRIGALGLIGICFGSLVLLVYKLAKPHIFKEN